MTRRNEQLRQRGALSIAIAPIDGATIAGRDTNLYAAVSRDLRAAMKDHIHSST
jgi:hypothetical protein